MNKVTNTEQVISRIDKYISLMRYAYSSQEKLSRLEILNDYYQTNNETYTNEVVAFKNVEFAEQLSGALKLPLKVKGVFLSEGRPRRKFYTAEELKKSAYNPVNQCFPLCLDHKDKEADKIIGMVDKIEYDPAIRALRWYGHINSEVHAMNVIDKAIKQVSATIFAAEEYDQTLGIVGKDLTFKELSLVWEGADPMNSITVDA